MEIRICKTQQEFNQLAELANEIWHEYFVQLLSPEQIDYMVDKFQSLPALERAIHEEGYLYFLLYEEGNLLGYCGIPVSYTHLYSSSPWQNSRTPSSFSALPK